MFQTMPFVHLHTVEGLLGPAQKAELMERFTLALIDIEGGGDPTFRQQVWIRIDEQPAPGWQIGTLRPTVAQIESFAAQRSQS